MRPQKLIFDCRGVAFSEALLVLPAFAVILAGALFINGVYSAKLEARARARLAAWNQAASGRCVKRSCTHGCGDASPRIQEAGSLAVGAARGSGVELHDTAAQRFGEIGTTSTTATGSASAKLPGVLGRELTTQHSRMQLLCNTRPARLPDLDEPVELACRSDLQDLDYAGEACP